jgi:hypothetical protein
MNLAATANDARIFSLSERRESALSFLASRSKSSTRALAPSVSDVFSVCITEVNTILHAQICTRTRAEFCRAFEESFPKYVQLTKAMSSFATAVVPRATIERLTRESISEMESDFRDMGLAAFGEPVRNQALFTVWTLRKINELLNQIHAAQPTLTADQKKQDREHIVGFMVNIFRAHFCVDCLNKAISENVAIYPEVVEELIEGLRSMVNAYGHARQGLELRSPSADAPIEFQPLDDEDRALLEGAILSAAEFGE